MGFFSHSLNLILVHIPFNNLKCPWTFVNISRSDCVCIMPSVWDDAVLGFDFRKKKEVAKMHVGKLLKSEITDFIN